MSMGRRRFLKTVPAAVAAGVALPSAAAAQRGGQNTPPIFGKDVLKCAEQIDGLQFTDPEEEMALGGVSRNLDAYEELRKLDVPLDTEPAVTFRPYLPGKQPKGRSQGKATSSTSAHRLAVSKPTVQLSASIEALAFEPVTALAGLIESRKISSTDLTKMYLARLKHYGNELHCVVTLTEELALQEAAAADKEIRAGRYRGPLHGIPWGAKDLLGTKGIKTTFGAKPYE